jgi:hypothetical protein
MKSTQAQAAALIRKELKAAFKDTKFSVTSESYSMGDSVSVCWENGPNREAVHAIVGKYQYGHFDSMTDCYEHSNGNESIPQTKFVQLYRRAA